MGDEDSSNSRQRQQTPHTHQGCCPGVVVATADRHLGEATRALPTQGIAKMLRGKSIGTRSPCVQKIPCPANVIRTSTRRSVNAIGELRNTMDFGDLDSLDWRFVGARRHSALV